MSYQNMGANRLEGLSTYTKPGVAEGVPINMILFETDTNTTYIFDGENWQFVSPLAINASVKSTLFIPLTDQNPLTFGDGSWNRTTTSEYDTTNDFFRVQILSGSTAGQYANAIVANYATPNLRPKTVTTFRLSYVASITDYAVHIGLSQTGFPLLQANWGSAIVSASPSHIGVGVAIGESNFKIVRNNETGTNVLTDTGIARDLNYHTLTVHYTTPTSVTVKFDDFTETYTTSIPAPTTILQYHAGVYNSTSGPKGFSIKDAVYLQKNSVAG